MRCVRALITTKIDVSDTSPATEEITLFKYRLLLLLLFGRKGCLPKTNAYIQCATVLQTMNRSVSCDWILTWLNLYSTVMSQN